MKTLILVDGSSYLYRAFHALPDLRTSRGEPTGAIRGVLSMLRLLVDGKPEYFAVVFDAPGKTFRDEWYPQYKANRAPMPSDLAAQIGPLHQAIRAHGWPLLLVPGVEADDVIGTLARQSETAGVRCVVSTSDKDLAQLVSANVTLVNTMMNESLDEAGVLAKFNVRPDQMIDYLTLIGDSVDNVPGVPKVGPKTAAKWLADYDTLDNLMAHASDIGGVIGVNLRASLDWLPEGRRLLTVKTNVELPVKAEDLVIAEADLAKLSELYDRFEFRALRKEVPELTKPEPNPTPSANATRTAILPCQTLLDWDAFEQWLARLASAELVSIKIEATSFDPLEASIVGISFALDSGEGAYLPLSHQYGDMPKQLSADAVLDRLKPWFEDPMRAKLGQNAKFEAHVLANRGIALEGIIHDVSLQSYVLESHRPRDIDSLAQRHLDTKSIAYAEICGKGASQIGFDQVAVDRASEYSAKSAQISMDLHRSLFPKIIQNDGLRQVYERIELPTREVLFAMERQGVLLDVTLLNHLSTKFGERLLQLETEAHALAGQPFNLGSPKQLGEILFSRLGLPVVKKTATGQPSTDEDVLQNLAADYPLPKVLLEHRALSKLKSTYTDKLPLMINRRTGRVHTNYAQAVAVTGRLSSVDPNLQNIPVRSPEGRRIREAFVAPAGSHLVSVDYSQIELRIMAHLSEDGNLLRAFAEGADIHRATAAEIFAVGIDEVTSEQRRYIKAVNFGLIYGMSSFGLAAQLGIERGAAQRYIEKYFARYPGVANYMQRTRELARKQGFVETVFGRRLWLTDINAGGGPRRQAAERAAINAPMQGSAADMIKLAMIAVQAWIQKHALATRLIMQVHDELVLEVPDAELTLVKEALPRLMNDVSPLRVPLAVEIGVGPNWDKAH